MRKNGEGYRVVRMIEDTDKIMRDSFWKLCNSSEYGNNCKIVNKQKEAKRPRTKCYQPSHCNWNRHESFI